MPARVRMGHPVAGLGQNRGQEPVGLPVVAVGAAPTPGLADPARAQVHAVKDALGPWYAGYDYYNFEETPAPASAVLPPASYRRLQEIKTAYDPDQAIISAHPVQPRRLT